MLIFLRAQLICGNLEKDLYDVVSTLLTLCPSSAGIERVFSTMGYIHDEKRCNMKHQKVQKLPFINRLLKD